MRLSLIVAGTVAMATEPGSEALNEIAFEIVTHSSGAREVVPYVDALEPVEIHSSAYRHGLTDDDIQHAWDNALAFHDIDADQEAAKSLCIGPDTAGDLLEVLFLQSADDELIIHAMPLRPVFRTHLTGEDS